MRSKIQSIGIAFLVVLGGCVPPPPKPPVRSQLEIRELQTREYPTKDTKLVMKALLNTLQDDGFVIKNAVTDLGLITASKELPVEHVDSDPGSIIFGNGFDFGSFGGFHGRHSGGFGMGNGGGGRGPRSKHTIIEASANVSQYGERTRVRVSFENKTVDQSGATLDVHQNDDASFYQEFFAKVEKGVFLQRERI